MTEAQIQTLVRRARTEAARRQGIDPAEAIRLVHEFEPMSARSRDAMSFERIVTGHRGPDCEGC